MRLKDNKKSITKKRVIILVSVVAGLLLILIVLEKTGVTNFVHTSKKAVTANEYTKGEASTPPDSKTPQNTGNGSGSTTPGAQGDGSGSQDKNTNGSTSGSAPITPFGDFVSDYEPNLGGRPHPNTLNSVCNTTPGAQCTITFTMGNTTKSLPTTTADAGGSVYWTWKLQDIGLSTGTWKIQATATLNNKTATADSPLSLEVKP